MFETIKDLWTLINENQKYFLIPLVLTLFLVGGLIVLAQTSILAPFIYTIELLQNNFMVLW
jgi:hypothetical protein